MYFYLQRTWRWWLFCVKDRKWFTVRAEVCLARRGRNLSQSQQRWRIMWEKQSVLTSAQNTITRTLQHWALSNSLQSVRSFHVVRTTTSSNFISGTGNLRVKVYIWFKKEWRLWSWCHRFLKLRQTGVPLGSRGCCGALVITFCAKVKGQRPT